MSAEQHKYRAMIRVLRVIDSPDGVFIEARIPAWRPHRVILIPVSAFPEDMIDIIECSPGPDEARIYLHAQMDLNAQMSTELNFVGPWDMDKMDLSDTIESHTVLERYKWDKEGNIKI